MQLRPGATQAQSEQEWFDLNQAIKGANAAINTEAQGAPAGTDHAKASVLAYIAEMYPTNAPPARAVSDAAHVPSSWKTGSAVSSAAKSTLFTKVVNPYCMSCHRVNSVDFTDYARFQFLGVASPGQLSMLKRYTTVNAADPNRLSLAFMPQAKLEWENLAADTGARAAIDAWLVVAQQP